jgi:hypothetical protein
MAWILQFGHPPHNYEMARPNLRFPVRHCSMLDSEAVAAQAESRGSLASSRGVQLYSRRNTAYM